MTEDPEQNNATFSAAEARILACLMEKELVTPDNYPLTLNSLTLACNQKSAREPVMNLSQGDVGHVVNDLVQRDLVRTEFGERANRFHHRMRQAYELDKKQQAILAVLMLRCPQTLNDIKTRTQRMVEFDGLEEVAAVLDQLMECATPLAVCLPKGPGQREDRYTHTLCGEVEPEIQERPTPPFSAPGDERLTQLEERVSALEQQLVRLLEKQQ